MLEDDKEYIIGDYLEWLEENGLENTDENIDNFITAIYYETVDNLELFESIYKEMQDMAQFGDKIEFIEDKIRDILKEGA